MTDTAPPAWRPGTKAAARRDEAVRRILDEGATWKAVAKELRLDNVDARLVAAEVRRRGYRGSNLISDLVAVVMGKADGDDESRSCPEVSPHPAVPLPKREILEWLEIFPGDGRVVEHTCDCGMTTYELLSYGGVYRIRRTTSRPDLPPLSFTHARRRTDAYELWRRLLAGHAR